MHKELKTILGRELPPTDLKGSISNLSPSFPCFAVKQKRRYPPMCLVPWSMLIPLLASGGLRLGRGESMLQFNIHVYYKETLPQKIIEEMPFDIQYSLQKCTIEREI